MSLHDRASDTRLDNWIGQLVGPYKLQALHDNGSSGAVYRAHHLVLNRDVAVKILTLPLTWDEEVRQQFIRELVAAAKLHHPHIHIIYDVGEQADLLYIAMALLNGESLAARLQRTGPFSLAETVAVLTPLAQALDYAHNHGVIHRDIRPANVIMEPNGHATLVDFGIARVFEATSQSPTHLAGRSPYLAPELLRQEPASPASEGYAFGVMTFELLTGRLPFVVPDQTGLVDGAVGTPAPRIDELQPDLPADAVDALTRQLARTPADRFPSLAAFVAAFQPAPARSEPPQPLPPVKSFIEPPGIEPQLGDPTEAASPSLLPRDANAFFRRPTVSLRRWYARLRTPGHRPVQPDHPSSQTATGFERLESSAERGGAGSVEFAIALFRAAYAPGADRNLLLSPLSIALALAVLYNGAANRTRQAIGKVLQTPGDLDQLNQHFGGLMASVAADPAVRLVMANALWAQQGLSFAPDYRERIQRHFAAEVGSLDFGSRTAAATINAWVNTKTEGLIANVVSTTSPHDVLYLVNAIYFKGRWAKVFDPALTKDRDFHLASGRTTRVPMMTESGSFPYYAEDDFEAVRLAYGQGRFGMYIFLPAVSRSLDRFLAQITALDWRQWLSRFEELDGAVTIPKFRFEFDLKLVSLLDQLGMGLAFDPQRADFGSMGLPPQSFLSQAAHRAVIEVNEEGTEAAAATYVGGVLAAAPPRRRLDFVAERPFFFAIADSQTGALLFLGTVNEPNGLGHALSE